MKSIIQEGINHFETFTVSYLISSKKALLRRMQSIMQSTTIDVEDDYDTTDGFSYWYTIIGLEFA